MGSVRAACLGYCGLYGLFAAVVVGATVRMWILDFIDERSIALPLEFHGLGLPFVGWGSCCIAGLFVFVASVKGAGGLLYEIPGATFNTYLLFKCTEKYIVALAVALYMLFLLCTWGVSKTAATKPETEAQKKDA